MSTLTAMVVISAVLALACGLLLLWEWRRKKLTPKNDGENFI